MSLIWFFILFLQFSGNLVTTSQVTTADAPNKYCTNLLHNIEPSIKSIRQVDNGHLLVLTSDGHLFDLPPTSLTKTHLDLNLTQSSQLMSTTIPQLNSSMAILQWTGSELELVNQLHPYKVKFDFFRCSSSSSRSNCTFEHSYYDIRSENDKWTFISSPSNSTFYLFNWHFVSLVKYTINTATNQFQQVTSSIRYLCKAEASLNQMIIASIRCNHNHYGKLNFSSFPVFKAYNLLLGFKTNTTLYLINEQFIQIIDWPEDLFDDDKIPWYAYGLTNFSIIATKDFISCKEHSIAAKKAEEMKVGWIAYTLLGIGFIVGVLLMVAIFGKRFMKLLKPLKKSNVQVEYLVVELDDISVGVAAAEK